MYDGNTEERAAAGAEVASSGAVDNSNSSATFAGNPDVAVAVQGDEDIDVLVHIDIWGTKEQTVDTSVCRHFHYDCVLEEAQNEF